MWNPEVPLAEALNLLTSSQCQTNAGLVKEARDLGRTLTQYGKEHNDARKSACRQTSPSKATPKGTPVKPDISVLNRLTTAFKMKIGPLSTKLAGVLTQLLRKQKGSNAPKKGCFAFEVLSGNFDRRTLEIGKRRLGQKVAGLRAGETHYGYGVSLSEIEMNPSAHRAVWFMLEDEGYWAKFGMLKSLAWMAQMGIEQVGDWAAFDLEEMGVVGFAQVMAIQPCPEIETAQGSLVISVFEHSESEIWEVVVAGESKPIRTTDTHPFWSADRLAWVAAASLQIGENLSGASGLFPVISVTNTGKKEPVYNIEVDADHCYRVGEQGLLVHNASDPAQECKYAAKNRRTAITNDNGTFEYTFDECRTTSAKGPVVRPPAKEYLSGGQRGRMSDLLLGPVGNDLRNAHQAGHLIGTQFGGPGAIENLVPMPNKLNLKGGAWYSFETWLRNCLEGNGRKLYGDLQVAVEYDTTRCYRDINIPVRFKIMVKLYYDMKKERIAQVAPYTIENKADASFSAQGCTID